MVHDFLDTNVGSVVSSRLLFLFSFSGIYRAGLVIKRSEFRKSEVVYYSFLPRESVKLYSLVYGLINN